MVEHGDGRFSMQPVFHFADGGFKFAGHCSWRRFFNITFRRLMHAIAQTGLVKMWRVAAPARECGGVKVGEQLGEIGPMFLPVIDQIHNQFYHQFFVGGIALCHQQRQRHQGIVIDLEFARFFEAVFVFFQKPDEKKRPNPFVAVAERVVFDGQVQQVGGLFFDAAVQVFAAESLHDVAEYAPETVVFLIAEQGRGFFFGPSTDF